MQNIKSRISLYATIALAFVAIFTVGAVVGADNANAGSQAQVNAYIRNHGGVPPCKEEDGSGQKGTCVWWAGKQGNGDGYSYLAIDRKGKDDAIVYITGPKAVRH